jgi:hypothetical protein
LKCRLGNLIKKYFLPYKKLLNLNEKKKEIGGVCGVGRRLTMEKYGRKT